MKSMKHYKKFTEKMRVRMEKGYETYKDRTLERPLNEIIKEAQDEAIDLANYSMMIYSKLEEMKK